MINGGEKYYFLFALALIWIAIAVYQDLRKREIMNWLNFSLIAFALAYKLIYSALFDDWGFFAYGVMGFGIFWAVGYALYYSRSFGGGDAKLLIGIGCALPFESYYDLALVGAGFIFLLFFIGLFYNLAYSAYLTGRDFSRFKKELGAVAEKRKHFILIGAFFSVLGFLFLGWAGAFFILMPVLYIYLKSVDACMTNFIPAHKLSEGDWLEKDVRAGRFVVKKSVHGLSSEDIALLKKYRKKALIKEGIPFAPVFLFAFSIMVFFFLALGFQPEKILLLLF